MPPKAGSAVSSTADATPLRFGSYTRGAELGRGASCRVFACKRVAEDGAAPASSSRAPTERLAAKAVDLRRLRLSSAADRKLKLLRREAEILKRVPPHENLVRFVDTVLEGEWLFFVLERVDGGDLLAALMKRGGEQRPKLTEAEALHIFRQLVEGLGFLHSQGVIHRDLKPENVLVSRTGKGPGACSLLDVKIADFGLSKVVGDGFSEARSTVGSPRYMAPEVVAGGGSYDVRADLWSLGILLFVLLDGRYPCDGLPKVPQARLSAAIGRLQVGAQARSVVAGLLRLRPEERLTLADLRRHPWLLASLVGAGRPAAHGLQALPARRTKRRRSSSSSLGSSSGALRGIGSSGPAGGKPRQQLRRRLSDGPFSAGDDAAIAEATEAVAQALSSRSSQAAQPPTGSSAAAITLPALAARPAAAKAAARGGGGRGGGRGGGHSSGRGSGRSGRGGRGGGGARGAVGKGATAKAKAVASRSRELPQRPPLAKKPAAAR